MASALLRSGALSDRLLAAAFLMSSVEEGEGHAPTPPEIRVVAEAARLRPEPLLALLGWLPCAKLRTLPDGSVKCVGGYRHRWEHGWDQPEGECPNVALEAGDSVTAEAWRLCCSLRDEPKRVFVYEF